MTTPPARPLLPATALLVAALAAPAAGQRPEPVAYGTPELAMRWGAAPPGYGVVQDERRPTLALLGGGLAGGAVGFLGGGLAGAAIACGEDDTSEGFCAIGGFVVGAAIGESALIPLGVHVVNRRRGNYGLALLASAAVAGAGLAVAIPQGEGAWLIPVPIAQLVTSIAIERATAREAGQADRPLARHPDLVRGSPEIRQRPGPAAPRGTIRQIRPPLSSAT